MIVKRDGEGGLMGRTRRIGPGKKRGDEQGGYDPVSRPVPRDGIRYGTGFFKPFLKKPVLQKFFFPKLIKLG